MRERAPSKPRVVPDAPDRRPVTQIDSPVRDVVGTAPGQQVESNLCRKTVLSLRIKHHGSQLVILRPLDPTARDNPTRYTLKHPPSIPTRRQLRLQLRNPRPITPLFPLPSSLSIPLPLLIPDLGRQPQHLGRQHAIPLSRAPGVRLHLRQRVERLAQGSRLCGDGLRGAVARDDPRRQVLLDGRGERAGVDGFEEWVGDEHVGGDGLAEVVQRGSGEEVAARGLDALRGVGGGWVVV